MKIEVELTLEQSQWVVSMMCKVVDDKRSSEEHRRWASAIGLQICRTQAFIYLSDIGKQIKKPQRTE